MELSDHITRFAERLTKGIPEPLAQGRIRRAIRSVPRHLFIERFYPRACDDASPVDVDPAAPSDRDLAVIYSDAGLMIRKPPNHSAASQPSLVVRMLEVMLLAPGLRVLEIGTGTGWNAGLLAVIVGADELVHTIDLQEDLVEAARRHLAMAGHTAVSLRAGDGGRGWPEHAPFDRIVATVGCPTIPAAWQTELADGGYLLVPLKTRGFGDPVVRLRSEGGILRGSFVMESGFMTLQGASHSNEHDPITIDECYVTAAIPQETIVELREPASPQFLAYVALVHNRYHGCSPGMDPSPGWLYDRRTGAVMKLTIGTPEVRVSGDATYAEDLKRAQLEWVELGRPTLADIRVEIVPADGDGAHTGWVERRGRTTFRFWLHHGPTAA